METLHATLTATRPAAPVPRGGLTLTPLVQAFLRRDTRYVAGGTCPDCGKVGLWRHYLDGQDGDDAKRYQERAVREALAALQGAEARQAQEQ